MANIDSILEQFSFDLKEIVLNDPPMMFSESIINIDDIYQEANTGVNKKNILHKLWGFIKKIMRLIAQGISKLIKWITLLFTRDTKSVDQIAADLQIPKNKKTVDPKKLVKKLSIRFNEDKSFRITVKDILDEENDKRAPIKGHPHKYGWYIKTTIYHIKNRELTDTWINLFERIVNHESFTQTEVQTLENDFNKTYVAIQEDDSIISDDVSIRYDDLVEFQGLTNKMAKILEKYDDVNNDFSSMPNGIVETLNKLASEIICIQMGLNGISVGLQQIYQIDDEYFGSIKDPDTLSKFAYEMIGSLIPVKYAINNILMISDVSLRGKQTNPDEPVLGQGRVILFPEKSDIVYKVAFNSLGLKSNINETNVSRVCTGTPVESKLAKVMGKHGSAIISMEWLTPEKINDKEAEKFEQELARLLTGANFHFTIDDININGFGRDKAGNLLLLDYGQLDRVSR